MTIILAGGSGFLGHALHRRFTTARHLVLTLSRHPRPDVTTDVGWQPDGRSGPWRSALADADVIINLAGASIGGKRWSASRKRELRDSRIDATRSLVHALTDAPARPRLLISSSAVGYYGARDDDRITEEAAPGDDFLAALCADWEQEANAAASATTRVATIRTGLVLHPDGGALRQMLLPFRLGLGGPMGSGRQYMSWIHLHDWVSLVEWIAARGEVHTRVMAWNATAPQPVTNAEFARTLGRVLRRPAFVPAPGFALRLLLGELAQSVLTGQRVVPAAAEREGFSFRFPTLEPALRDLLDR